MPKGTMIVIDVNGSEVRVTFEGRTPDLQALHEAVGGYIEIVPYFERFRDKPCIAYCNEEGKIMGMGYNRRATEHWHAQIDGNPNDVLVGPIVVLTGDPAWMRQL